jgi:hypothetical protein
MIMRHLSSWRRLLALVAVSTAIALGGGVALTGATASAQEANTQLEQSRNWAGYVVHDKDGQSFSSVSGSWTEPAVSPESGDGYSAFWVGLGGASQNSRALEQIGTTADVVDGTTHYSAWYELVPAPETKLSLAIHPGDRLAASVTVAGERVTLSLADQTTGQSLSKTLQMYGSDTSSAEWIAEAPSRVTPGGGTQILPLANFGRVTFTDATATAGGHTGPVSDPDWTVQATQLSPSGGMGLPGAGNPTVVAPGVVAVQSSAGASPNGLSNGGTSFSVAYAPGGDAERPAGGESGYPTGGNGYGGPYVLLLPGGYVVVI